MLGSGSEETTRLGSLPGASGMMPGLRQVAPQEILIFSLQLVVTLLALRKRAPLFLERLLEIANSFLKTDRHFRYGRPDGIAELNFNLIFFDLWLGDFPQVRHFPDLATCTVASVDDDSFAVDFAEPNKFPQSTERSRS